MPYVEIRYAVQLDKVYPVEREAYFEFSHVWYLGEICWMFVGKQEVTKPRPWKCDE
jgi:hypothetical protein